MMHSTNTSYTAVFDILATFNLIIMRFSIHSATVAPYCCAVLKGSEYGRYETHRSLCIRFLSRDPGRGGHVDDVIWSQVVMRVQSRGGGDRGTSLASKTTTIVCWNHVVGDLEAAQLQHADCDDELEEIGGSDAEEGPLIPATVVRIQIEERDRGTATAVDGRLSSQKAGRHNTPQGGSGTFRGDVGVSTSEVIKRASSNTATAVDGTSASLRSGQAGDGGELSTYQVGACGLGDFRGGGSTGVSASAVVERASSNTAMGVSGWPESEQGRRAGIGDELSHNAEQGGLELFRGDATIKLTSRSFGHPIWSCDDSFGYEERKGFDTANVAAYKGSISQVAASVMAGLSAVVGTKFPDVDDSDCDGIEPAFLTTPSPPFVYDGCRRCYVDQSHFRSRDRQVLAAPLDSCGCSETTSVCYQLRLSRAWSCPTAVPSGARHFDLPVLSPLEVDEVLK